MRLALVLLLLAMPVAAQPRKPKPDPLAVVILIDRSQSMKGERLEVAREAVRVAAEALDADDAIGTVGPHLDRVKTPRTACRSPSSSTSSSPR